MHADEASHWDGLHAYFEAHRINHSEAYSLNGVCTNQAESYFSRLRRMAQGQHHHVSPRYLHQYAVHAAWMEDHRAWTTAHLPSARYGWRWCIRSAGMEGILAAHRSLTRTTAWLNTLVADRSDSHC